MKKIMFCNIPMSAKVGKHVYKSEDYSIPVSNREVTYPISAFLEKNLTSDDEIKVILLVKKDKFGNYKNNVSECIAELMVSAETSGAKIEYKTLDSEFNEEQATHDGMLLAILDELEEHAHILADITYGPKDLPIVLFTAMNFAERFFDCEIDNIVYGQATFDDGKVVNTKICDMIPLYYLNSVTNTMQCSDPDKAKHMLKNLLSM